MAPFYHVSPRGIVRPMRCPVCASEKLSEETEHASSEVHLRFKDWEPGFVQYKALMVYPARGRVCLACGYLLFFAGEETLETLRKGRPG
jgi:predicted Zn-ribbon and HTH transcriptional regulator